MYWLWRKELNYLFNFSISHQKLCFEDIKNKINKIETTHIVQLKVNKEKFQNLLTQRIQEVETFFNAISNKKLLMILNKHQKMQDQLLMLNSALLATQNEILNLIICHNYYKVKEQTLVVQEQLTINNTIITYY